MLINLIILACAFSLSFSANIFGFIVLPFISHGRCILPIFEELANRGHNVTLLLPIPVENISPNITIIDTKFVVNSFENSLEHYDDLSLFELSYNIFNIIRNVVKNIIEKKEILSIIQNTKFDVLIIEQVSVLALFPGFLSDAPIISITSTSGFLNTHDAIGNPTHPIITPNFMLKKSQKLTFTERVISTFFDMFYRFLYYFYELPKCNDIINEHFKGTNKSLTKLQSDISLFFYSTNPILSCIRANVPTAIEISKTHIKPVKSLPHDLKIFLDSAKNGAVYFSLGTNAISLEVSKYLSPIIKNAFESLPYKILWKTNADIKNVPRNVMIKKWFPQNDILAHPNLKVFVTQGGFQSMEEALYNAVPMVGIPLFADQWQNVQSLEARNIGIALNEHHKINEKVLVDAITTVANSKTFKKNIVKLSSAFKDEPLSGVDKAVWWVEYVITHQGAAHLRGSERNLPFYQYYLLDVIVFSMVILLTLLYLLRRLCIFVIGLYLKEETKFNTVKDKNL